ncbi:target of rapamycin complex 2 subunit MAPKAP1-like isoform X1 [Branchiostoma floridae x Branchiostoma belcheri]
MAFIEDPAFVLSYLRQAFITSDDTGMSEMVLVDEDIEHWDSIKQEREGTPKTRSTSEKPQNLEYGDISQSFDITASSLDWGIRRRTNTAQRLEKLKKERQNQVRCRNVQWKEKSIDMSAEEMAGMFEKKDLSEKKSAAAPQKTSVLAEQLEQSPVLTNNPFIEFSKFDGKGHVGSTATKRVDIFLTMTTGKERNFPLTVVVLATARVQDLIGLICWQYTNEAKEPKLIENVEAYCLHIAEDDGEVDTDFPALDAKEPFAKFGFTTLALVEKPKDKEQQSEIMLVTVNVPHSGFSRIQVESLGLTMKEILHRALKRRKGRVDPSGPDYVLEKQSQPGVCVDLDSTLESMNTMEFCLVRQHRPHGRAKRKAHGTRGEVEEETEVNRNMSEMEASLSSLHYKSYRVNMFTKLRTSTIIQLGVSGEKIEIDPLTQHKSTAAKFLSKQKPVSYDADLVAACEVTDDKHGRETFRLTYQSGSDFKHHDFEASSSVASEVVTKINHILELRASPVRADYLAFKERKASKKHGLLS